MGFPIGEDATENQFDAAFHTSGSSTGLQKCINLVGKEGKVVELSWYGTKQVVLKLGGNFHSQRKQIISSQVGQLPSNRLSRWDFKRRKHLVMKLLENSVFDTHLTSFIPFDESPKFFDALRKGPVEGLGHCIVY
jgi:threonine dehydrogenase-like Zn-dependent dehydrogenase